MEYQLYLDDAAFQRIDPPGKALEKRCVGVSCLDGKLVGRGQRSHYHCCCWQMQYQYPSPFRDACSLEKRGWVQRLEGKFVSLSLLLVGWALAESALGVCSQSEL